jgi:hypothetical protein
MSVSTSPRGYSMRRGTIRLACVLALLSLGMWAAADVRRGGDSTDAEKFNLMITDNDSGQRGEAIVELHAHVKKIRLDGVRELETDPHPAIAMYAAWEEAISDLDDKPARLATQLDLRLERFLGFVEGRLSVNAPEWWKESLLSIKGRRRTLLAPLKSDFDAVAAEHMKDFRQEKRDGDVVVVTRGMETVPIPLDLMKFAKEMRVGVMPTVAGGNWYFTSTWSLPFSSYLYKVNPVNGKVIWETVVWGQLWRPIGLTGGGYRHYHAVHVSQGRVIVFGAGNYAVYVEGFDERTGKCLFRFSTYRYFEM